MAQRFPVLATDRLTEEAWAVLFTVSYYTPLPVEQVVELAALEVPGRPVSEVRAALEACRRRGWVTFLQGDEGAVLTDEGLAVKSAWPATDAVPSPLHSVASV